MKKEATKHHYPSYTILTTCSHDADCSALHKLYQKITTGRIALGELNSTEIVQFFVSRGSLNTFRISTTSWVELSWSCVIMRNQPVVTQFPTMNQ